MQFGVVMLKDNLVSASSNWRSRNAAKLAGVGALAALLMASSGCSKLQARDQLNKGVQAYKASRFEQAVEHFKNANQLDPNLTVAKLYLATACVAQYVPGGESPNNLQLANCAIDEYKVVLEADKGNKNTKLLSLKGLASLYFNMKKFDQAKEYDKQAIEVDPNDPDNYYSVAVIDWTQSYVPRMEARGRLGLKLDEPIKDKKACEEVKAKNQDRVKEGIDMLEKAIRLRKDYADAMAYLNLMYRERADIQCGDAEARSSDLKLADDMVQKTMAIQKLKAEKANEQHGIVLDTKQ